MTDRAFDPDHVAALRDAVGLPDEPGSATPTPGAPAPAPDPAPGAGAGRWRRALTTRARRLGAPVVARVATRVAREVDRDVRSEVAAVGVNVELLKGEVRALAAEVGPGPTAARDLAADLEALTTNVELLKGELRGAEAALDELGRAIAPGAGLDGAAPRLAELRERLNALDRRVRLLADRPAPPAVPPAPAEETAPASADEAPAPVGAAVVSTPPAGTGSGFDYVGFEQRFRGDQQVVLDVQEERYLERLLPHQPVLDVGCGRGELLRMLAEHGVAGVGVDLDEGMVAEAIAAGVDAHHGDALDLLRRAPEGSFGAITAMHVVEHLELGDLVELLELAATRLRPGGLLIAETPNPATLVVLGNSYILDPTHVWPLHPSLLTFLCERAGFRDVELLFGSPATDYQLAPVPTDGPDRELALGVNAALGRLNHVLFGPQEYAVLATTPEG